MNLRRRFQRVLRTQPKARLALAGLAAVSQLCLVAFAGAPPVAVTAHKTLPDSWICSVSTGLGANLRDTCHKAAAAAATDELPQVTLPAGSQECPASGPGVTCSGAGSPAQVTPGVSSMPAGTSPCPVVAGKLGPATPASCNDTVLAAAELLGPTAATGTFVPPLPVQPSIPVSSLAATVSQQQFSLSSNVTSLQPGQSVILTATSSSSMTGTPYAIEIFDQTTGTLAGACMQSSQCMVAYAAMSGAHTFAAFITLPTAGQPAANSVATSEPVTVTWLGVTLITSSASVVRPGGSVTFRATTTTDVSDAGAVLGIYDLFSNTRLTYCSHGTTCSTTLTKAHSGKRAIVAYLAGPSATLPPPSILAQSQPITATWLGVSLAANTTYPRGGGTVYMQATANADLTNTPWSIGIYDGDGNLVGTTCKSGASCSARIQLKAGPTPWFTAVIGAIRPLDQASGTTALSELVNTPQTPSSMVNIQAQSAAVQPTRLLWGVDSCKPLTTDALGAGGLYKQVKRYYGTPNFWGRYMTTTYNCPGLSPTEIAAAAYRNLGILPIYNDYDCNAVRTYAVGRLYAAQATAAAANLGIPQGRALAIDIEPYGVQCPGAARVDAGFIEGWYDGLMLANYVPLYYGNGTMGSEFGTAWCRAVSERPEVAVDSFLWTFQPSLWGRFKQSTAPEFSPNQPGCAGNFDVWQYVLSTGAKPDVDSDEALSTLPLWFPQAAS